MAKLKRRNPLMTNTETHRIAKLERMKYIHWVIKQGHKIANHLKPAINLLRNLHSVALIRNDSKNMRTYVKYIDILEEMLTTIKNGRLPDVKVLRKKRKKK